MNTNGTYLIITTNALKESLTHFIELRSEKYAVEVKTVEQIYLEDSKDTDEPEELRGSSINHHFSKEEDCDVTAFYAEMLATFYYYEYPVDGSRLDKLIDKYNTMLHEYEYRFGYIKKALIIRNFIQKRYNEQKIKNKNKNKKKVTPFYVLLAGDIGQGVFCNKKEVKDSNYIPAFYAPYLCEYPEFGNPKTREMFKSVEKMQILTDFFYANLTIEEHFNKDLSSYASSFPLWDIIVSRIPASTPDEMREVVKKYTSYYKHDHEEKKIEKEKYYRSGIDLTSNQKVFDNGKCVYSDFYMNALYNVEVIGRKKELLNLKAVIKYHNQEPHEIVETLKKDREPPLFTVAYRGDFFDANSWAVTLESNKEGGFTGELVEQVGKSPLLPMAIGVTGGSCWLDRIYPPLDDDTDYTKNTTKYLKKIYGDVAKIPDYDDAVPIGKTWILKGNALTFLGNSRAPITQFNQPFHEMLYANFKDLTSYDGREITTIGELVKESITDTYLFVKRKKSSPLSVAYADNIKMYMLLGDPAIEIPEKIESHAKSTESDKT